MSAKAELDTGNMTWGCVSSHLPPAPQALGPVVTLDTGPVLAGLSAELFGCGCRAAFEVTQMLTAERFTPSSCWQKVLCVPSVN